jgi:hypothetical protein
VPLPFEVRRNGRHCGCRPRGPGLRLVLCPPLFLLRPPRRLVGPRTHQLPRLPLPFAILLFGVRVAQELAVQELDHVWAARGVSA